MNKNTLYLLLFFSFCTFNSTAQDSLQMKFDKARTFLAKRNMVEAIRNLRPLYVKDPNNANINFLIGAAYTEINGEEPKALYHLKKAVQDITPSYTSGSYQEKAAPVHAYYYLILAFVESEKCNEAHDVLKKFKEYSDIVDSYYIEEADRQLQKCPIDKDLKKENWKKVVNPPETYDPGYIEYMEEPKVDSFYLSDKGIVTKPLEYTTNAPLYGVQIGSSMNPVPLSRFDKVKNIDVFIDNEGKIRYVVGHFAYRKQAETLLKTIHEKGYEDAFVVDVNDERKYSEEVISYQNINLRATLHGRIDYYIQLGAFKKEVPKELMELYLSIDGITELSYNDLTLIVLGPYQKYNESLNERDKLTSGTEENLKDSFIIAFNKGLKVSLEEAIKLTDD